VSISADSDMCACLVIGGACATLQSYWEGIRWNDDGLGSAFFGLKGEFDARFKIWMAGWTSSSAEFFARHNSEVA